jgi:hypothetical protein
MAKVPTSNEKPGRLYSEGNPQQGDFPDEREGAYDSVGNQKPPDTNQQTEHERAQPGADVRGEPIPAENFELPEGLKRPRMGPYDRDTGRSDVPAHVPKPGAIAGKNLLTGLHQRSERGVKCRTMTVVRMSSN